MSGPRYYADLRPHRLGAVMGPEANGGDGGTIAYVCDTVGDEAAQGEMAQRIADALNGAMSAAAPDRLSEAIKLVRQQLYGGPRGICRECCGCGDDPCPNGVDLGRSGGICTVCWTRRARALLGRDKS